MIKQEEGRNCLPLPDLTIERKIVYDRHAAPQDENRVHHGP